MLAGRVGVLLAGEHTGQLRLPSLALDVLAFQKARVPYVDVELPGESDDAPEEPQARD